MGDDLANKNVIDLCCNEATVTRKIKSKHMVFVDVVDCGPGQFGEFHKIDVLSEHEIFTRHYDIALCLDGIEHIYKPQGFELLKRMEKISDKQILFTPLGEDGVNALSTDPYDHKCGWYPEEIPGYASLSFPNYHGHFGAFFFWKTKDIEADFERIKSSLHI
jgi:hypothetical protein